MMKRLVQMAAVMFALAAPAGVEAATTVSTSFNTTCTSTQGLINAKAQPACSSSTNGTYGNSIQLTAGDGYTKVLVSAWQASQSTNVLTSAYLGAYSGGLGVTGLNDSNGANNLHTIDNVTGYTDLLVLQFDRAVQLTGISATPFPLTVNGTSVTDSDFSYFNASGIVVPSSWNSRKDISSSASGLYNDPSVWTNVSAGSTAGSRSITGTSGQFSNVWLVSASMAVTDRNDGFKLSAFTVAQVLPVPEPATWLLMISGFGGIGWSMRRRRREEAALAA